MRASFDKTFTQFVWTPPGGALVPTGLTGTCRVVPQGQILNLGGGIALSAHWITSEAFFGIPTWLTIGGTGQIFADVASAGIIESPTGSGTWYVVLQTQGVTPTLSPAYYRYLAVPWF